MERNYNEIDLMKFVMAIFVVAIHTHPEESIDNLYVLEILKLLYSIAVPFFFVASGFFLGEKIKYKEYDSKLSYMRELLSKVTRLYVLWTIIYLPYSIMGFYREGLGVGKSVLIYIRNICLVGENYLSWPLWYLLAMIVSGGIIYLLLKFKFSLHSMISVALLMFVAGILLDTWHSTGAVDLYFVLFKHTRNGFFYGYPFMMIGLLISCCNFMKNNVLLCLILLFGCFAKIKGFFIGNFLMVYSLFSIAINIRSLKGDDNAYMNFRISSTVVYFVHMLWVGFFVEFISVECTPLHLFLVVLLLSFVTSVFVINNKNKRVIKALFG